MFSKSLSILLCVLAVAGMPSAWGSRPTPQELDEILAAHQRWVESEGKSGTRADLTNADLSGAKLTNADLTNADLTNADLRFADLTNADLRFADLTNAHLSGAILRLRTYITRT